MDQFPHVRRAFPLHPNPDATVLTTALAPGGDSEVTDSADKNETREQDIVNVETASPIAEPPPPRYSLRSSSTVQDLPNVMPKPTEYVRQ